MFFIFFQQSRIFFQSFSLLQKVVCLNYKDRFSKGYVQGIQDNDFSAGIFLTQLLGGNIYIIIAAAQRGRKSDMLNIHSFFQDLLEFFSDNCRIISHG